MSINRNMHLFGAPYQFTDTVDPRVSGVSSTVGKKYMENIMLNAPMVTIIPGSPKYISNENNNSMVVDLIQGANDDFSMLKQRLTEGSTSMFSDEFRYYDFQRNYTDYMSYVNIMCRACASFMELGNVTIDETGTKLKNYDWRNYRVNSSATVSRNSYAITGIGQGKYNRGFKYQTYNETVDAKEIENKESNNPMYNFVQFYVDPSMSVGESMSNETSDSKFKGVFDNISNDISKEFQFITNSAGVNIDDIVNIDASTISDTVNSALNGANVDGPIGSIVSRIASVGGNVIKGENIIMPKIYQSSNFSKQYQFTVHLRAPYGSPLCYYLDVCVPLLHLIALALPKQTTGNTYGSPFLVKGFCDGLWTCNMGIVSNVEVSKNVDETSYTVDGLPNAIDVTVHIEDLYSDMMMSPQTNATLFANNGSLVEYLATTCGLSLVTPQIQKKVSMIANSYLGQIQGVIPTAMSAATEMLYNKVANILHF